MLKSVAKRLMPTTSEWADRPAMKIVRLGLLVTTCFDANAKRNYEVDQ